MLLVLASSLFLLFAMVVSSLFAVDFFADLWTLQSKRSLLPFKDDALLFICLVTYELLGKESFLHFGAFDTCV